MNVSKRRDRVLKALSTDDIKSIAEVSQLTGIPKPTVSKDMIHLIAIRKVVKIQSEPVYGYKLK